MCLFICIQFFQIIFTYYTSLNLNQTWNYYCMYSKSVDFRFRRIRAINNILIARFNTEVKQRFTIKSIVSILTISSFALCPSKANKPYSEVDIERRLSSQTFRFHYIFIAILNNILSFSIYERLTVWLFERIVW